MEMKFYICEHCGNIIGMVKDSGVPVVCCGQKMKEIVPGTTDASVEKHVPVFEVKENKVEENYDNYTYIPSQDSEIKSESNEDGNVNEKKYIPAQTPVKVSEKTYDNSGLSDALKRADRAEKLAIDTLNGKFNNML